MNLKRRLDKAEAMLRAQLDDEPWGPRRTAKVTTEVASQLTQKLEYWGAVHDYLLGVGPRPPGLSEQDLESYQMELERLAEGFEALELPPGGGGIFDAPQDVKDQADNEESDLQ
jgi:hypothetical protein